VEAALLPAAVVGAFAGLLLWQVLNLQALNDREKRIDALLARAGRAERLLVDADASLRGWLVGGEADLLDHFHLARQEVPALIDEVQELVGSDPAQQGRIEEIERLARRWQRWALGVAEARAAAGPGRPAPRLVEGEALLDEVREQLRAFEAEEDSRRSTRSQDAARLSHRTVVVGGLLALLLVVAVAVAVAVQMRRVARLFGEALRARDEFISVASHELRTPLTSLQLQVQLLGRSLAGEAQAPPGEQAGRRLAAVEQSTRRLALLVDRLLDVSRLGAGTLQLTRERVELADLVAGCLNRQRERLEAAGVPVELRAVPVAGRWDRQRLESVVTNLVDNALRYGEGRPIELTVSAAPGEARLEVRDHGIGIDPRDQERIFQRFERAASHQPHQGLGVGLWLARQVVEAHGGTIGVESRPGEGATFRVVLPAEG
jgi:signal transduction histidine kinase